jgi:hypothetical protein
MYSTTSSATCPTCAGDTACDGTLERPRYFARQLVTPTDLNLEAGYFMDRLRRHNRTLHGWGVVCGAQVCQVPTADGSAAVPWKVRIRPGILIDGWGNEVRIGCERIVDLRSRGATVKCGDPPGEVSDPWCSDVMTGDDGGGRVWVAVCHRECLVRPVRVQPAGCGCDDTSCEYSRWQDGYDVRLLDACPASHQGPPPTPQSFVDALTGPIPDCPPCPDDPCVVLAAVDVGADGTISAIDNCSCRRMIVSFATFWWRCAAAPTKIDDVSVSTKGPYLPGMKQPIRIVVKGEQLSPDATATLGQGTAVRVIGASDDGTTMRLDAQLADDAAPGDRTLTITDPDCSTVTWPKALTVSPPPDA